MGEDPVEGAVAEGQGLSVGLEKVQVPAVALLRQPHAGVAEAVDQVDGRHRVGLFGKRQRHPAAATAGIEHTAADGLPDRRQMREDLCAAVVLEQGVVVLGAEPQVRVVFDQSFVNRPH